MFISCFDLDMDTVRRILESLVSSQENDLFDSFVHRCLAYYDAPVHSIHEMRSKRNTKVKGDLFEAFCILFLRSKGYTAWLLKEVPEEILTRFGMKRFDVGIDIIAVKDKTYSAVQCKFKKPRPGFVKGTWLPYNCVNWKELSTFYSLCQRTQEKARWKYHIVMTNTKHTRRMGNATRFDKTYAHGSFSALTRMDYVSFLSKVPHLHIIVEDEDGNEIPHTKINVTNIQDMREKRLSYFLQI
jgi:hypothetical protein